MALLFPFLVLVFLLGNAPSLVAQKPGKQESSQNKPGRLAQAVRRRMQEDPDWLKNLNLSPDQVQRMRAITQQYRPQIADRTRELRQMQAELQELMAGAASTAQIRRKYGQVQSLKQQVGQLHLESMLSMREILTLGQRRQFVDQMRERRLGKKMFPLNDEPSP